MVYPAWKEEGGDDAEGKVGCNGEIIGESISLEDRMPPRRQQKKSAGGSVATSLLPLSSSSGVRETTAAHEEEADGCGRLGVFPTGYEQMKAFLTGARPNRKHVPWKAATAAADSTDGCAAVTTCGVALERRPASAPAHYRSNSGGVRRGDAFKGGGVVGGLRDMNRGRPARGTTLPRRRLVRKTAVSLQDCGQLIDQRILNRSPVMDSLRGGMQKTYQKPSKKAMGSSLEGRVSSTHVWNDLNRSTASGNSYIGRSSPEVNWLSPDNRWMESSVKHKEIAEEGGKVPPDESRPCSRKVVGLNRTQSAPDLDYRAGDQDSKKFLFRHPGGEMRMRIGHRGKALLLPRPTFAAHNGRMLIEAEWAPRDD